MRTMRTMQGLFVWAILMFAGVLDVEARVLQKTTFLPLPVGQQTSVERWKDSLRACVESGRYEYVCIEGNAIDMMYNNQYVQGNAALGNLMENPGHLKPVHDSQASDERAYTELLQYILEYIRAYNQKGKSQVRVVGLSYGDAPFIGFDSRVWHVAQYNQAGLTDSLMTYLVDEESDNLKLARLTVEKLDAQYEHMEKSLGSLDYFVWRRFFVRRLSHGKESEHRIQCEDFRLLDQSFQGRKLVIGCSELLSGLGYRSSACGTCTDI